MNLKDVKINKPKFGKIKIDKIAKGIAKFITKLITSLIMFILTCYVITLVNVFLYQYGLAATKSYTINHMSPLSIHAFTVGAMLVTQFAVLYAMMQITCALFRRINRFIVFEEKSSKQPIGDAIKVATEDDIITDNEEVDENIEEEVNEKAEADINNE